jgi:cytochrome c553
MLKKSLLFVVVSSTLLFASDAKTLLEKNCASCHMLTTPTIDMIPELKAPAMDAVGFHLKLAMQDPKEIEKFIVDYVQNPDASKSVCESNKVQKFGVMPSLKGKVSKEDLEKIAAYIAAHYPSKAFSAMIKEVQKNDKMSALLNSPFLINKNGLPHLTKLLIQNWDKAKLGLTPEQKEKLLKIRKDTLSKVKKLKEQISTLETEVIEAMVDRENPKTVDAQIEKIAKLKAEATRVHLQCIYQTLNILNDDQVAYLLPFGDY